MPYKILLPILVFTAAMATSCRAEDPPSTSVTILPGNIHEECRPMTAGQPVSYSYTAAAPLEFNVHYHQGPEVFYLAQETMSLTSAGSVVSPTDTEICLMWTNGMNRDPVTLDYEMK